MNQTTALAPAELPVDQEVLELLMSAVRVAREHQITTLGQLRLELAQMYPYTDADRLAKALDFWASHEAARLVRPATAN